MAQELPAGARVQQRWATCLRGDYGEISNSQGDAVDRTVQAAGEGWTWERMQSVGWRLVPVTVVPGHGRDALDNLRTFVDGSAEARPQEVRHDDRRSLRLSLPAGSRSKNVTPSL